MEKQTSLPIEWTDTFCVGEHRVVFTEAELQIPGLRVLGWQNAHTAAAALPEHFHKHALELTYTSNTQLTFSTSGQLYSIHGGEVFCTQPDQVHSTNEVPIALGEIFWIQLDMGHPEHFLFLDAAAAATMQEQLLQLPSGILHPDTTFCTQLVRRIIRETLQDAAGYRPQRIASYLLVYLHLLLQSSQRAPAAMSPDIQRVCAYITAHIREPLPLSHLAVVGQLSLPQFKRKFQQQIGMPPGRYVAQQKIEAAVKLLSPGCSLTEIAMDLHFCDSSYFSAVFKKFTGMTPTQYLRHMSR